MAAHTPLIRGAPVTPTTVFLVRYDVFDWRKASELKSFAKQLWPEDRTFRANEPFAMIASAVFAPLFNATKIDAGAVDRLQTEVTVIPEGWGPPVATTQTLDANRRIACLNAPLSTVFCSIDVVWHNPNPIDVRTLTSQRSYTGFRIDLMSRVASNMLRHERSVILSRCLRLHGTISLIRSPTPPSRFGYQKLWNAVGLRTQIEMESSRKYF